MNGTEGESLKIRLILFSAGLFGCVVFSGFAVWAARASAEWRAWTPVQATMLEARVGQFDKLEGAVSYTYYEPHVLYAYELGGEVYESTRLAGSTSQTTDYADAAGQIADYPAGATVTAHVNPADPVQALLRPEMSPLFIPGFIAAGVLWLLLWGGLGWILGRSSK